MKNTWLKSVFPKFSMKLLGVLFFVAIFAPPSYSQVTGQVTNVGTTAAQFLKIDPSPRGAAMGGAFVSIANDVSALYWNVAGIAQLQNNEVLLSHTNWFAGIGYDYGAAALVLGDIGTIGLSITSLSMGDMEVRTVTFPEGTGEKFSAGDLAFAASYARNLTDMFSIGFTAKYVNEYIWHMSASAVALDIATLYRTGFHGLALGMSISNFGTPMKFAGDNAIVYYNINPGYNGSNQNIIADLRTDSWNLPLTFRFGVSFQPLATDMNRLIISVDALHPNDNTESLNLGGEYIFYDVVSLRAGYRSLFQKDSEGGLTLGAGVAYNLGQTRLKADFGWANYGRLLSVTRFALGIQF